MDTDCLIKIWVFVTHDCCSCATGGETRDKHAIRVHGIIAHDLARDISNERWFSAIAALISWSKPIPAFGGVGGLCLFRIGDKTQKLLRDLIHLRPRGKIVGRLSATVEHDNEGKRSSRVGAGT